MTVFLVIVRVGVARSELVAAAQRSLLFLLLLFVLIIVSFVIVVVCSVLYTDTVVINSGVVCQFAFEGSAVQFDSFTFACVRPTTFPLAA